MDFDLWIHCKMDLAKKRLDLNGKSKMKELRNLQIDLIHLIIIPNLILQKIHIIKILQILTGIIIMLDYKAKSRKQLKSFFHRSMRNFSSST
jgi:hypothetical protein